MTKINLDELIADREAGTDGPWYYDNVQGRIFQRPDPLVRYIIREMESSIETNARRIARLPDLEAAYIEAMGLLDQVAEGRALHTDITDFLERNT